MARPELGLGWRGRVDRRSSEEVEDKSGILTSPPGPVSLALTPAAGEKLGERRLVGGLVLGGRRGVAALVANWSTLSR